MQNVSALPKTSVPVAIMLTRANDLAFRNRAAHIQRDDDGMLSFRADCCRWTVDYLRKVSV